MCSGRDSNLWLWNPLDIEADALPTEPPRPQRVQANASRFTVCVAIFLLLTDRIIVTLRTFLYLLLRSLLSLAVAVAVVVVVVSAAAAAAATAAAVVVVVPSKHVHTFTDPNNVPVRYYIIIRNENGGGDKGGGGRDPSSPNQTIWHLLQNYVHRSVTNN